MEDRSQKILKVTSSAFEKGGMIPSKHTCDAENVSPHISWEGAPEGTKSFVIISYDPDVPMRYISIYTWIHWVVYNIPPDLSSLPEGIPEDETLENGAMQGMTSFKKIGYGGPCPPFGTHRYYFKVYALDTTIDLEPKKATKNRVLKAIEGHILAEGELMGRYRRQRQ